MSRFRHFLSLRDLSARDTVQLLELSNALRQRYTVGRHRSYTPLESRTLAMVFEKRSTRTRVSTETGMAKLGGHALFLSSADIQLGAGEPVEDTARVLSRYNDAILARVYNHDTVVALAQQSSVPVINALSDERHPLQILADLMTLRDRFGSLDGLTVAWVGDGNNVLHSFMGVLPKLGMNLRIATPPGFEPWESLTADAHEEAKECGTSLMLTNSPREAVTGADVVVTDTWVSMGQEAEKEDRLKTFDGYRVTERLCDGAASPNWVFMHCLPRYEYEVDDDVFYGTRSLVWDEAENRMWTVMGVLHTLLCAPEIVD